VNWKRLSPLVLLIMLAACSDNQTVQSDHMAALFARGVTLNKQLRDFNEEQQDKRSGLLIQLAFGAEADLDLYVTDPQLETVYFANKEGKSGGIIGQDQRCESSALRVEEVYFAAPLAGRYRVGVDYPRYCEASGHSSFEQRSAYTLSIFHGGKRQEYEGTVGLHFFEVAAFDFDIALDLEMETNNKEPVHASTTP